MYKHSIEINAEHLPQDKFELGQCRQEEIERRRKPGCRPAPSPRWHHVLASPIILLQSPELQRDHAGLPPRALDWKAREEVGRGSGGFEVSAVDSR